MAESELTPLASSQSELRGVTIAVVSGVLSIISILLLFYFGFIPLSQAISQLLSVSLVIAPLIVTLIGYVLLKKVFWDEIQ